MKVLREVRITESDDETKVGDRVLVDAFKTGEFVDVTGVSKGRGFAGGVKRWHYAGGDARTVRCSTARRAASAAVRFRRASGRTSTFRVTWATRVTAKNLKVIKVDTDENLLLVRGSVPGPAERTSSSGRFARRSRKPQSNKEFCKGRAVEGGTSCDEKSRSSVKFSEKETRYAGRRRSQSEWQEGRASGLADAVFGAKVNPHLLHEASRWYSARFVAAPTRPRTRAKSAAQAASCGGKRAPAARVSARFGRLCGAMAERFTDRSRALTLRAAEEDVAGRVALGAVREIGRTETDRG